MRPSYLLSHLLQGVLFTASISAQRMESLVLTTVPGTCRDICDPIEKLTAKCDKTTNGRIQGALEQCICTDASTSALCAYCIKQSSGGRDSVMDDIMSVCSFSSTSYAASATSDSSGTTASVTHKVSTSKTSTHVATTTSGTTSVTTTSDTITSGTTTSTSTSISTSNDLGQQSQTVGSPGVGVKEAVPTVIIPALAAIGILEEFGMF